MTTMDDMTAEQRSTLWAAFADGMVPRWYDGPGDQHWTAGVDRLIAALTPMVQQDLLTARPPVRWMDPLQGHKT